MHKALVPAALVALLALIVDAGSLSAQSVQAQPPAGMAPGGMPPAGMPPAGMAPAEAAPPPMRVPSATTRTRTSRIRASRTRTERTRTERTRTDRTRTDRTKVTRNAVHPAGATHRRRHVVQSPPPNQREIAERDGYKRLSDLVKFPKLFPGLGIIFVKPDTIPLGPFLCFDRNDRLIATVYMVSMKDIDDHKSFEAPGFAGKVDHFSYYFNPGHPGMDMPHYHIVIWHVSKEEEARAAH
jgi:hypothetical protein